MPRTGLVTGSRTQLIQKAFVGVHESCQSENRERETISLLGRTEIKTDKASDDDCDSIISCTSMEIIFFIMPFIFVDVIEALASEPSELSRRDRNPQKSILK
jgi:hypothetical protein